MCANPDHSVLVPTSDLVDHVKSLQPKPKVIDLSGGNPAVVPEWSLWVIEELVRQGIGDSSYVWCDNNLTFDIFDEVLTNAQLSTLASFHNFGMVGCFKGFDEESFEFNTRQSRVPFTTQFEVFSKMLSYGWEMYGYVTFTTVNDNDLRTRISDFVDRLQDISEFLPLRTVPLEILPFGPTTSRMDSFHVNALEIQYAVLAHWQDELRRRFTPEYQTVPICDVPIRATGGKL